MLIYKNSMKKKNTIHQSVVYDINNGELWNYHNCSQNYKTYLEVFVKWSG